MESKKMALMILYAGQQGRHIYKITDFWTVGEGEGGMI